MKYLKYLILIFFIFSCSQKESNKEDEHFIDTGLVTVQFYPYNANQICIVNPFFHETIIDATVFKTGKILMFGYSDEKIKIISFTSDLKRNCLNVERGENKTEKKDIPANEIMLYNGGK